MYIIGENHNATLFKVLKVDRLSSKELSIVEDEAAYTKKELSDLLDMIALGNRSTGGLHTKLVAYGIIGTSHSNYSRLYKVSGGISYNFLDPKAPSCSAWWAFSIPHRRCANPQH